jgi:DUF4097 and DUF4098 domain-containing protein YvlB
MYPVVGRLILVPPLLALILASGCGGSSSGFVDNRPWAEEPFSFNEPVGTQTALQLQGVSGTIEVTGTPGATSIAITGVKRVQANTLEDATAHLAQLNVEVGSSANEVLVQTVQPKFSAGRNYIVNYTISLPQDIDCSIISVNGQILADAIHGSVFLALVNGQITASVTLPSAGEIDMSLVNGNIDLRIPQTTSAEFSATNAIGSITLTNLSLSNETVTPGSRTGTLGSGDGTISLDAGNGTIAVQGI